MIEVTDIAPDSTASRLKIAKGDRILSINGAEINDVVDYQFHSADDHITIALQSSSGKNRRISLRKDPDDLLGIQVAPFRVIRCRNKCMFCFVDQMPGNCRRSLYVKDDDYRASFLYGNYITLGSLTEKDWERIFAQRLSPLYISVHATDRILRNFILGNKKAPDILRSLQRLAAGGIRMHTQIVLVPGVNDGIHLKQTIEDLSLLFPAVLSIAVVPVGLTAFRHKSVPLRSFTASEAREVIARVSALGLQFKKIMGTRLVFVSDEFYRIARLALPRSAYYEDFPQIENGVGMVADFLEAASAFSLPKRINAIRMVVVTGVSFSPILQRVLRPLRKIQGLELKLITARNRFFGPSVTVAGLLSGGDIFTALHKKISKETDIFIPTNALNDDGALFLDGMSICDLEQRLEAQVHPVSSLKELIQIAQRKKGEAA